MGASINDIVLERRLTQISDVDKRGDVGRPPMKTATLTSFRLDEDVKARIVALVGQRRMAVFLREAAIAELDRREAELRRRERGK